MDNIRNNIYLALEREWEQKKMQFDFDDEEIIENNGGRSNSTHDYNYQEIGNFYKNFSFKLELYDPLDRDIPKYND